MESIRLSFIRSLCLDLSEFNVKTRHYFPDYLIVVIQKKIKISSKVKSIRLSFISSSCYDI